MLINNIRSFLLNEHYRQLILNNHHLNPSGDIIKAFPVILNQPSPVGFLPSGFLSVVLKEQITYRRLSRKLSDVHGL